MAFDVKQFLDFAGLEEYDALIKKYIQEEAGSNETVQALVESLGVLTQQVATDEEAIAANAQAIEILNGGDEVEGSVAKQVKDAVAGIVDGAPEALDTLKEIAAWIAEDETGATTLVSRVAENENAIAELQEDSVKKAYVDEQDEAVYDSIQAISALKVNSLFPVTQKADQTAVQAIAAVEEGQAIKLAEDQEIAGEVVIDKSCYIDANGSTFTGTVTVPADAEVIIENAVFSNPVVMA